jgi:Skp family chaperone for outer membrane proteins
MKKILIGLSILVAAPIAVLAADSATAVMPGSDRDSNGCIGSAGYAWSESSQKCVRPWEQSGSTVQYATGLILPPVPPVPKILTGTEAEIKALQMAIQSLSETDKVELSKIIRTYLEWKGVKIPTGEQVNQVRGENTADRQEVRKDIKDDRSELRNTINGEKEQMKDMKKPEKQEMKQKIQNQKSEFRTNAQKKRQEMRTRIQDRRANAGTASGTVAQ